MPSTPPMQNARQPSRLPDRPELKTIGKNARGDRVERPVHRDEGHRPEARTRRQKASNRVVPSLKGSVLRARADVATITRLSTPLPRWCVSLGRGTWSRSDLSQRRDGRADGVAW